MILDEGEVEPRHMPIIQAYRQEFGPLDDLPFPVTIEELERMCRAVVESSTCSDFRQEQLLQCDDIDVMSSNGTTALLTSFGEAVKEIASGTWSLIRSTTELAVNEEIREELILRTAENRVSCFLGNFWRNEFIYD